ncbi:MAG: DUF692 domain-containing protein [FCB group bacterium]|nr:DUF692 domain-containing protein [FCB group bacterium]
MHKITMPISHLVNEVSINAFDFDIVEVKFLKDIHRFNPPWVFHFDVGIVNDLFMRQIRNIDWTGCELFSFHLGPACRRVKKESYYHIAESPVLDREIIKSIVKDRVARLRELTDVPLAVENGSYFPFPAYTHICEPDFITEIVEENRLGLVFDIAHAMITAHNAGVVFTKYIDALPLDKIVEIHLTGTTISEGTWKDLHNEPDFTGYAVLNYVLCLVPRDVHLTLEYYRDLEIMRKHNRILRRLANVNSESRH